MSNKEAMPRTAHHALPGDGFGQNKLRKALDALSKLPVKSITAAGCVDEAFVVAVRRKDGTSPALCKALGSSGTFEFDTLAVFLDKDNAIEMAHKKNDECGVATFGVFRVEVKVCEGVL